MALSTSRRIAALVAAVAAIAVLVYLRDPPWLPAISSGFASWRTDASGIRYRPMRGHASFFVPSEAATVSIPVRAPYESPVDWPIVATFSVDDKPVDQIVLADDRWHTVTFRLPQPTGRRVRRIDIHADRTRSGNRGPHVGGAIISSR